MKDTWDADNGREEVSGCVMAGMVEMRSAGNSWTSSIRFCVLFTTFHFLLRVLLGVRLCVGSCVLFLLVLVLSPGAGRIFAPPSS